jgi:hypothetical protein
VTFPPGCARFAHCAGSNGIWISPIEPCADPTDSCSGGARLALQFAPKKHSVIGEGFVAQRPVKFECELAREAAAMHRMNPSGIHLLYPVDDVPHRCLVRKNPNGAI